MGKVLSLLDYLLLCPPDAFNWRMACKACRSYEAREILKKSWNSLLIDFHKLSRAYSQAMLVSKFYAAVVSSNNSAPLDASTKSVLLDLFRLFALHTMDFEALEFQNSGAVSSEDLNELPARVLALLRRI